MSLAHPEANTDAAADTEDAAMELLATIPSSAADATPATAAPQVARTTTTGGVSSRAVMKAHWDELYARYMRRAGRTSARTAVRKLLKTPEFARWQCLSATMFREMIYLHEGLQVQASLGVEDLVARVAGMIDLDEGLYPYDVDDDPITQDTEDDGPPLAQDVPSTISNGQLQPQTPTPRRTSPRIRSTTAASSSTTSATTPRRSRRSVTFDESSGTQPELRSAPPVTQPVGDMQSIVQLVHGIVRRIMAQPTDGPPLMQNGSSLPSSAQPGFPAGSGSTPSLPPAIGSIANDSHSRATIGALPWNTSVPPVTPTYGDDAAGNEDVDIAGDVGHGDSADAAVEEAFLNLQRQGGFMHVYLNKYRAEHGWKRDSLKNTASTIADIHDAILRQENPIATRKRLIRWLLAIMTVDSTNDPSAYVYYQPSSASLLAPNTVRHVGRQLALIHSTQPKRERVSHDRRGNGGYGGGADSHKHKKSKTSHRGGDSYKKPAAKGKSQGAADAGGAGN